MEIEHITKYVLLNEKNQFQCSMYFVFINLIRKSSKLNDIIIRRIIIELANFCWEFLGEVRTIKSKEKLKKTNNIISIEKRWCSFTEFVCIFLYFKYYLYIIIYEYIII